MKLLSLLQSLQQEEHKDFEKFLQSPFFKDSEQYLKFFRCLCKHYPSFELGKADLESAYRRCFGHQSLNDTKLYNLMSGLSKQVEQYLVVRVIVPPDEKPGLLYEHLLVKALGLRNTGAYFRKQAQQLISETLARPRKELDDYHALSQLHFEIYFNPDTAKSEDPPPHLKLASEYLDLYYCIAKLRLSAEMKARERIFSTRFEPPLLEAVLAYGEMQERSEAHALLGIFHRLVTLYQQGVEEAGFRDLQALFLDKFPVLTSIEQRLILPHLINCGGSLLQRGCSIEKELLSLYKLAMEAEVLLDGNRITHMSFINVVHLAILCGETDWAEGFIAEFAPYLEESKRAPVLDFARASLHYDQGRLDEAQVCLNPDLFQMPMFDLLGRSLLIRICFDRYVQYGKDYEFLNAQLGAFEKYVQSQDRSATKKTAQLNWVRFLRKMAAVKFEQVEVSAAKKGSLRRGLEALPLVSLKKWLGERIEWL